MLQRSSLAEFVYIAYVCGTFKMHISTRREDIVDCDKKTKDSSLRKLVCITLFLFSKFFIFLLIIFIFTLQFGVVVLKT